MSQSRLRTVCAEPSSPSNSSFESASKFKEYSETTKWSLAALFALGSIFMLPRWPETISIDEMRIHQSAWCHRDVSILWQDIVAIDRVGRQGRDSLRSGPR